MPAAANALTCLVERTCHQNLPFRGTEYAAELAQIIYGSRYLTTIST